MRIDSRTSRRQPVTVCATKPRQLPGRWMAAVGFAWVLLVAGCGGGPVRVPDEVVPPLGTQRVTFVADDGFVLFGTLARPTNPTRGVICLPGWGGSRADFHPLMLKLQLRGIASLAFDLRGSGESVGESGVEFCEAYQKRQTGHFLRMKRDIDAARQYLVEVCNVDPRRVALVGAGVGGSIVLVSAHDDVDKPVTVWLSPGKRYLGIDATALMGARLTMPMLLTFAEQAVGEQAAAETIRRTHPKPDRVQLRPVPGSYTQAHGARALRFDETLADDVVRFLAESLR